MDWVVCIKQTTNLLGMTRELKHITFIWKTHLKPAPFQRGMAAHTTALTATQYYLQCVEPWWAFNSNFIYTIWNYTGLHVCNLDFVITSTLQQLMYALRVSSAEPTSTPHFISAFLSHPTLHVSHITTEICRVCWKPPWLSFWCCCPFLPVLLLLLHLWAVDSSVRVLLWWELGLTNSWSFQPVQDSIALDVSCINLHEAIHINGYDFWL